VSQSLRSQGGNNVAAVVSATSKSDARCRQRSTITMLTVPVTCDTSAEKRQSSEFRVKNYPYFRNADNLLTHCSFD